MNRIERLVGLGGILYPVLVIGGLALALPSLPPDYGAPPEEIARFVADHPVTGLAWVGLAMEGLGLSAMVLFLVSLGRRLPDLVGIATIAFGTSAMAIKGASVIPVLVAVDGTADLSAESLAVLFRLNDHSVAVSEAALMLAVGLASAWIAAGAALGLPRWTGWFGLAAAAATFADLAGGPGLLSLVTLAWLVPTSVLLVRVGSDAPGAAPGRVLAERL